jgi:hypothetical protein
MRMTMKLWRNSNVRAIYRVGALGVCWLWLAGACGGKTTGTPVVGSESHFLMHCTDSCDSDLSCIAGLCTKSCITGVDDCSELASAAVCTNQSVEPGAVAVCDVSCTSPADCAALGDGHTCDGGFCRRAALDSPPLSEAACDAYLDQTPPPIELPGVTIVNTTDHTLYIQPYAPTCRQEESLVRVGRIGVADDVAEVNIQGSVCAAQCNDVADNGWSREGEGSLGLLDCPGIECAGPPAAVPIEPGESILERARLEWVPERLPRGCAAGITTDAVNCYKRAIPARQAYAVWVSTSAQPDCTLPSCQPTIERAAGSWFYEDLTIELRDP